MNALANFLRFGAGFWQYRSVTSYIEEIIKVTRMRCRESGVLYSEEWRNEKGESHNTEGPAEIKRDMHTGHVTRIVYAQNGYLKRADGLAPYEEFDEKNGALIKRLWSTSFARPGGLPNIEYYDSETGKLVAEQWTMKRPEPLGRNKEYMFHRTDGPAWIEYDPITGAQTSAEYYINGRRRHPEKMPSLRPEFNP